MLTTKKVKNENRFMKEVTLLFNLSNDPCYKYNLNLIIGYKLNDIKLLSERLVNEVFYFETDLKRYELSLNNNNTYNWFEVNDPYARIKSNVPLDNKFKTGINKNLKWNDINWLESGIEIVNVNYNILKLFSIKKT